MAPAPPARPLADADFDRGFDPREGSGVRSMAMDFVQIWTAPAVAGTGERPPVRPGGIVPAGDRMTVLRAWDGDRVEGVEGCGEDRAARAAELLAAIAEVEPAEAAAQGDEPMLCVSGRIDAARDRLATATAEGRRNEVIGLSQLVTRLRALNEATTNTAIEVEQAAAFGQRINQALEDLEAICSAAQGDLDLLAPEAAEQAAGAASHAETGSGTLPCSGGARAGRPLARRPPSARRDRQLAALQASAGAHARLHADIRNKEGEVTALLARFPGLRQQILDDIRVAKIGALVASLGNVRDNLDAVTSTLNAVPEINVDDVTDMPTLGTQRHDWPLQKNHERETYER